MNPPSPPAVPDPKATSAAQTSSNVNTAIANTAMGNANQVTPYGTITYDQTGKQTISDGNGGFIDAPTYTVTQTPAAAQQAMIDLQNKTGISMDTTALQQAQQIGQLLSTPVNASMMHPIQYDASGTPTLTSQTGNPQFQTGALQSQTGTYADPLTGYSTSSVNPTLDTSGVSSINPNLSLNPNYAGGFNNSGLANATNVQGQVGPASGFSQDALNAQNAIMSRLDPQLQIQKDALGNQLVNEGFQRGSEAYNTAMDQFNRQANDANMQAVLQGYNVEGQLFGQQLQQGQFANSAQQQAYNEALGRGQFGQTAQSLSNQAMLGQSQFNLGAQNQQYQQALSTGQFGAAATAANNAAAAAKAQFTNSADAQKFAQDQAQLAFNNTVATQGAEAANQAAQQAYQNAFNNINTNNASAQQQYNDALAAMQAANQAQAQGFQQTMGLQSAPINNISALMSGGQVAPVQGAPYSAGVVQPTPVSSNVYNSAALDQQNYQNQLAQQNAMMGGLFGLGSAGILGGTSLYTGKPTISDRRLKRDITDTGLRLHNGLSVYAFKYVFDNIPRIGLMADEVRQVRPEAVIRFADGYDRVDYNLALA